MFLTMSGAQVFSTTLYGLLQGQLTPSQTDPAHVLLQLKPCHPTQANTLAYSLHLHRIFIKHKKKKRLEVVSCNCSPKEKYAKTAVFFFQFCCEDLVSSTSPTLSAVCTDCKLLKPISESAVRLQKYTTLTST